MEYIVNQDQETFKIIMFNYDGRNWEICFESFRTEIEIQDLISRRVEELTDEYLVHGNYNSSDLFVDYTDYKNDNNI